jgi:hypothetical protein
MSLPDLSNWDDTKSALHQSMQVLRSTRLLGVDPMPSDLHYSTIPTPYGASSGELNFGGELRLDYGRAVYIYLKDGADVFTVSLESKNQTSLFDTVFAEVEQAGHSLEPNRAKVTQTTPFALDKSVAATYAELQWRMYGILGKLKGRMYGPQTPIALWPHGFDISSRWYVDGMNEREDPHVNFGFSPGTPDVGQPYFYFYAWPAPDGLSQKLPDAITWNAEWGVPGGFLKYEQFANESDPDGMVLEIMTACYHTAADMLRKT